MARFSNRKMPLQIEKRRDSPFCSTAESSHSTQHVRTVHLASSRYVGNAFSKVEEEERSSGTRMRGRELSCTLIERAPDSCWLVLLQGLPQTGRTHRITVGHGLRYVDLWQIWVQHEIERLYGARFRLHKHTRNLGRFLHVTTVPNDFASTLWHFSRRYTRTPTILVSLSAIKT